MIVDMTCIKSSDIKRISNDEVIELIRQLKFENKSEAKDQIVLANLKLVLNSTQKFKNRGENINDVFQLGCIGLIKAIDNFDLSKETKFSTYAVWMIEGEIRRYLRDNSLIRVNRSSKSMLYKINKAKEELISENRKEPSNKEIAEKLNVKEVEVDRVLLAMQSTVSLSEPVNDDNEKVSLSDKIKDDRIDEEYVVNNLALVEALNELNDKEKKIINMRYFMNKTQAEIASEFGVSQVHIGRLEKNAIKLMKDYLAK